jgi:adenylylsulfate kinase
MNPNQEGDSPMSTPKSQNITWTASAVSKPQREARNRHRGVVLWFTGLSASGKTTLSQMVEQVLFARGCHTYILDGDNIRHGLNRDLGFSPEDREENIRRIGEVAKLMADAGMIALTAFISPYRADRDRNRAIVAQGDFVEIYCRCSVEECERRDPKGLYKKARAGLIPEFTGISAPYEAPENAELVLDTDRLSPQECVELILAHLHEHGVLGEVPSPVR